MTDWIFQGNGQQLDLDAAVTASRLRSWRTPRYRDRTAAGDRVWLQVVGRHEPGIYYLATIRSPTYEDPEWQDRDPASARWRTDIRFDYRIDPPLLRAELLADSTLASFRPFRGFQGSTWPVPADIAAALRERAAARLDPIS
jgi:EVE domain